MKIIKRKLAALLLLTMMMSALPSGAFAKQYISSLFLTLTTGGVTPITTEQRFRLSLWSDGRLESGDISAGNINLAATNYAGYSVEVYGTPDIEGRIRISFGDLANLPELTARNQFMMVEYKDSAAPATAYTVYKDVYINNLAMDRFPLIDNGPDTFQGIYTNNATTADTFTIDRDSTTTTPTIQFGKTLAKTIQYDSVNTRFNISDSLRIQGNTAVIGQAYIANDHAAAASDGMINLGRSGGNWQTFSYNSSALRFDLTGDLNINSNQIVQARIENVSALPGGAGGAPGGTGAKGRIVQLTATDSVAPGCTSPTCSSGTYTWDGSTWHSLQGSVTASTATKIVTVGPTGRDYTSIAAAATYCNTLSGCEMWIDPGTYSVTTSVDLENVKLVGADGGGITQISITGAGQLLVKDTFFYELNINIGAITAATGMNVKFNATSASSVLFSKVNFSINTGKFAVGSTAGTAPTTAINFQNCSESASDPGAIINAKASSGLNTGTSSITVINLLTKDPLKISDWPVTIVGGSNVVTTGTITSVPDRTILVSQDMDINNAIQSLISSGGGGVVKLLVGTHNITSPIIVNSGNIEIVGEGPGTIVNVPSAGWTGGTGATVAAIQVGAANGTAPVSQVNIRNFTLKVEPDIHGIKVNGGSENKVMDMIVQSTGLKAAANTHTGIVFTDSTTPIAAGTRLIASRNIINRSDATSCVGAGTGFCWVDGIHFDGDAGFGAQSFGYSGAGSGITDSIISENIVNETKQTSYVFTGVTASGIFSNRARNIGITNGSLGLAINNATDDTVINNSIETNNNTTTNGISIYNNVQSSTFIGNAINNGGTSNYSIGIDLRSGATPSNNNIVSSNQINGAATGINVGTTNSLNSIDGNQFLNTTTRLTDSGTNTKLEVRHHEATANPTVADDITRGYSVGTIWVNTSTNSVFVSTNSTTGAAVWTATSGSFHAQNTDTGTTSNTFTLDNDNTGGNVSLIFGTTNNKVINWDNANAEFNFNAGINVGNHLTINGGTPILDHLSTTVANFVSASISSNTCGTYGTMTVTGAAVGDTVVATPVARAGGIETVNLSWNATVTAANTVTIRACNTTGGSINTANTQTWRADIWQH